MIMHFNLLLIDYSWYNIKGVNICTSAPKAGRKQAFCSPLHPGMNAYTERIVGTIVKNKDFRRFVP